MKRHILLIVLLCFAGGCIHSQDTIWQRVAPLSNYFNNRWIDTTGSYVGNSTTACQLNSAVARRFITKDTLQIYGIAAMMADEFFTSRAFLSDSEIMALVFNQYPEDPTFNNCEEALLLYQFHKYASPEMQQLGDSLWVNRNTTAPTHYMMTNRMPLASWIDTLAKPIYERYFTTPQTVHDTFYAGFTHNHWAYNKDDSIWYEKRPIFGCFAFDHNCEGALWVTYHEAIATQHLRINGPDSTWAYDSNYVGYAFYIFPILTPEPPADTTSSGGGGSDTTIVDTTFTGNDTIAFGDTIVVVDTLIVGGDTIITYDTILSVLDNDLTSRLTGVMPNPAAEKARVVSSFGMSMVEVFDLNGSAVLKRRTEGLYTDIDVSRWPTGTYLVRIHTPQGIATKKLVVSR